MKTRRKKSLPAKAKASVAAGTIRRKSQSNGASPAVATKASVPSGDDLLTRFENGQSIAHMIDFRRGKRVVIK